MRPRCVFAIGGSRLRDRGLIIVEVFLFDFLLEGGMVAALGVLLFLDGAAGGGTEAARSHRERKPGHQPLEVGRGAGRAGRDGGGTNEHLELVATGTAAEVVERHALILPRMPSRRRPACLLA